MSGACRYDPAVNCSDNIYFVVWADLGSHAWCSLMQQLFRQQVQPCVLCDEATWQRIAVHFHTQKLGVCVCVWGWGWGGGRSRRDQDLRFHRTHSLPPKADSVTSVSPPARPHPCLSFCNHFCILPANRFLRVQAEAPRVCFSLFVCCGKTREQLPPVGSRGIQKLCVPSLPSSAKVALCKQGGGGRSVEVADGCHRERWRLARGRLVRETAHSPELSLRVIVELVDLAKLCSIGQGG